MTPDGPAPGDEPSDLTLAEVLAAAAGDVPEISEAADGGATIWLRGDRPFAVLTGDVAEFRLDPLVAGAALRTPDASASLRGPDWVAFRPAVLDDGGVDRAEAWFLSAHRRAAAKP